MAAATLEPPLRPRATMWGTSMVSSSSLLSTTLTNPTGTPMTRAGFIFPSSMSWQARTRAVGALPMASTRGPSRAAARSMDTVARVSPRSLASAATSGSDMKHTALPPNFSSTRLFTPEKAIWVSVTMVQPAFMAAIPFSTAPGENTRLSAYSKSAVVWITRLTTGSWSAGKTRSPSSWAMSSMLRASMSAGATRCS